MKRKVLAFFAMLVFMLPTTTLADAIGCPWPFPALSSFAGVALVGISVSIILYSRRP